MNLLCRPKEGAITVVNKTRYNYFLFCAQGMIFAMIMVIEVGMRNTYLPLIKRLHAKAVLIIIQFSSSYLLNYKHINNV